MSLRIFVVCSKPRDGTSCVARLYGALFPSPSKDDGASGCDALFLPPRDRRPRFGSDSVCRRTSVWCSSKAAYSEYCDGHSEGSVTLNWMLCPVQSQQPLQHDESFVRVGQLLHKLIASHITPLNSVHPAFCSEVISKLNAVLFVGSAAQFLLQSATQCYTALHSATQCYTALLSATQCYTVSV